MDFLDIKNDDNEYIVNSYKRFDVAFSHGKGSVLYDFDGKEYIDFTSGIGVNSFGINDDLWTQAVISQATKLSHISNLYYTLPQVKLAKLLCSKTNMKRVFFANSGAESNECAIKAARKYSFDKYGANRHEIITLNGSFHGRTMATLTATGQDKFHNYFFPFVEGFKYVDANDIEGLKNTISNKTCAIMIEIVQGEGGVNNLDEEFILAIDKLCKEHDIIFIIDEVQTGNGRTGNMYAYMDYDITPNIVTTAKGIAGGLPLGAILFDDLCKDVLTYGLHGTTFGGNPIACSAALSICERLDEDLFNHVKEARKIVEEVLNIKEVNKITGKGLMIGVDLATNKPLTDIVSECIKNGLIVLTAGSRIRLLPPLNITNNDLIKGLNILKGVLQK